MSGPARTGRADQSPDDLTRKAQGSHALSAKIPYNVNKAEEYGRDPDMPPSVGASAQPDDPIVGASTVQESFSSEKVGSGSPVIAVTRRSARSTAFVWTRRDKG